MNTTDTLPPETPAEAKSRGGVVLQRLVRGHLSATLYLGDCQEMLPMKCDAIICDPPYPDYHAEAYGYTDGLLEPLRELKCRQLIFWSARADFPLDWTARHVWDKRKGGVGSAYEFVYERNGGKELWVLNYISPNNSARAAFGRDVWTGHPSQKPIQLMKRLVADFTKPGDTVLDPWMGSGSTGLACLITGRNFVGMEKNPTHYATACSRLEREANQGVLL